MNKKPHRWKLHTVLWMSFTVFSFLILLVMILLQSVAFDTSYREKEQEKVRNLGDRITAEWKNVRFSQPVSVRLYEGEAIIRIFNKAGASQYAEVLRISDPDPLDAMNFILRYEEAGEEIYFYQVKERGEGSSSYLVYGSKITNEKNPESSIYISIVNAMGPRDIVKDILFSQYFFIACIMLVLASVLSYFLAAVIAKPLETFTEEAGTLAEGNYDVHFRNHHLEEIDRLAETMNYATGELVRLDQVRDEVMGSVSHDLRTPLTVIKAYGEMLQDFSGAIPEKRSEHVAVILREVEWMRNLVDEILEYTRIRYGSEQSRCESFDLVELTENAIANLQATTLGSGVGIILHRDTVPPVIGDPARIQRVLHNLITNAIKHNPEDMPLEIGVKAGEGKVRWYVMDYGQGIPESEQKLIWKRYYTNHDPSGKGIGLGLSIVKAILEDHGAGYGIESRPGEGCRFWFEIRTAESAE